MDPDHKPGLWQWVKKGVKQALLWVAIKTCQVVLFIVDTIEMAAETVRETAKVTAELTVAIIQRVREDKIVQTIGAGVDILKKLKDAKEFPGMIRRTGKWIWAFATGKACFSWAASSGWCTLCSLGYAALLVSTCVFSLYVLGLLSTVFRS